MYIRDFCVGLNAFYNTFPKESSISQEYDRAKLKHNVKHESHVAAQESRTAMFVRKYNQGIVYFEKFPSLLPLSPLSLFLSYKTKIRSAPFKRDVVVHVRGRARVSRRAINCETELLFVTG